MAAPTIEAGSTGSIEFLVNGDIGEFYTSGTYFVSDTCTGLPDGQSVGILTVETAQDAATNVHMVRQTFEGLYQYSDIRLTKFNRFAFPLDLNATLSRSSWIVEKRG